MSGEYDYLFKIIITGDGAVGKTAITVRFSQGKFDANYKMTIGVDFAIKMLEIDNKRIKLQLWDTGGQERFSYIRPLYYKGAMGNVLVFDLTNRSSYDHLEKWYNEVLQNCGNIPSILVGNKADLPDRAVSSNEAQAWGVSHGMRYFECSAKTGQNVGDVFAELAKILVVGPEKAAIPGASIISKSPIPSTTPPGGPMQAAPSFTAPPPKPATPAPSFTAPPPKPTAPAPSFPTPPPKPTAPAPSFPTPPPKPAAPAPSFTAPPPKPAAPAPSFPTPPPKPAAPAPSFPTPPPKPAAPAPSFPTPQPKPAAPAPSFPTPPEKKDEALDEALRLLDVEEPSVSEPIPEGFQSTNIYEPQPLEIPDVETPIPIEEPSPIPIEEPSPMPIEEPSPMPIEEASPIPIEEASPIPIEEPSPIPIEEPSPIPIEEPSPMPIEEPSPMPIEEPSPMPIEENKNLVSTEVSEQKSGFIPFQAPKVQESSDISIEDVKPVDILNENASLDIPSPEVIIKESGIEEGKGEMEESSIFGITSTAKPSEEKGFTPFTTSETETSASVEPAIPTEEVSPTDLFTALSQKKNVYKHEKKAPRFIPFIPTAEGEYEEIELEIIKKDEKEIASTNMIRCPACNREIPADWKFCTYCGTLLK
ncbi:MAG: GTP-binding protein [Candidatus Helarchaeota archaeon]